MRISIWPRRSPVSQLESYPLQPPPSIAVLRLDDRLTEFQHTGKETLAGPVTLLRQIAASQPRALAFPLVAFSGPGLGWLNDDDRNLFWLAFRVPVFEQLFSSSGQLIADECSAHRGLHLRREHLLAGAIREAAFELDRVPCPCGRTEPRLLPKVSAHLPVLFSELADSR